jgi:hypothetical protein
VLPDVASHWLYTDRPVALGDRADPVVLGDLLEDASGRARDRSWSSLAVRVALRYRRRRAGGEIAEELRLRVRR